MIRVRVPATMANVGPGFDCMGIALSLYNYVELEETETGLKVENCGRDAAALPTDETNLVVKSIRAYFKRVSVEPRGLFVRVTNEVPVSRGMGSSAACIVGGIVSANRLAGNLMSQDELLHLAVELEGHPDNVTPALLGGVVVSSRDEEGTDHVRFDVPGELECLMAIPNVSLSTKMAREALPKEVPFADAVYNVGKAALLTGALMQGNYAVVEKALGDRLHQPYRSKLLPSLEYIYEKSREKKMNTLIISGAGPTLAYLLLPGSRNRQDEFVRLLEETPETWELKKLQGDNTGAVFME